MQAKTNENSINSDKSPIIIVKYSFNFIYKLNAIILNFYIISTLADL